MIESWLQNARHALHSRHMTRRVGVVRAMRGLSIESEGPSVQVGELCAIVASGECQRPVHASDAEMAAARAFGLEMSLGSQHASLGTQLSGGARTTYTEVVGMQDGRVTLMPFGNIEGLSTGDRVYAVAQPASLGVGYALLGRVIDGFGQPLDGFPCPQTDSQRSLKGQVQNPMTRPRIDAVLETGIRIVDSLLTLGRGQRVGIFAGSGVGKSTLLGMLAKHVKADINVIALIGERGREVREFIEKQLGPEGLARSVIVVATADQPALSRMRAAKAAIAIAEYFRDDGRHVVLTMDSITRYAMARREVGLAAGEPPTARGYTPSVFSELPELCERCGTSDSGGSITALFTVLVEGDDFNEPVSDALRAVLDGHIVLSRQIAHQGQYPAIDVLKSASRLLPDLTTAQEREQVTKAVQLIALLERNQQMVELGAYEPGSNPQLDAALAVKDRLHDWLRQVEGGFPRQQGLHQLWEVLQNFAPSPQQNSATMGPPGVNQRRTTAQSSGSQTVATIRKGPL